MKNNNVAYSDIQNLKWAIDQAECWRGSMVGNPDPRPLNKFDEDIKRARRTLMKLRKNYKSTKK